MATLALARLAADVTSDNASLDICDHFVERDGLRYAGAHLIIDMWGARRLDDLAHVELTIRAAADAAGATTLECRMHHFQPNDGVTGVLILAESHISIHTWPERGFAAIDIFMCGDTQPHLAIEVLKNGFAPEQIQISELKRGILT